VQELTGWKDAKGRWLATALTAGAPLLFVMRTTLDAKGQVIPAWRTFWGLFGASNQLLAALTLLGVLVWLVRTGRGKWAWVAIGLPTVWMYTMSLSALVIIAKVKFTNSKGWAFTSDPVAWVAVVLVGLALLMLVEAIRVLMQRNPSTPAPLAGQPAY
jgi:carbon starvation protein